MIRVSQGGPEVQVNSSLKVASHVHRAIKKAFGTLVFASEGI